MRAAVRLTGLPDYTIRSWERRYQAVTPGRDGRGRVCDQQQIQPLLLLREVVERGHGIGDVAALKDDELKHLLGGTAEPGLAAAAVAR